MSRTLIRQDTQIHPSSVYDDTIAPGSTMESSTSHIEDDLNSLRSMLKRIIYYTDSGNWYDDMPTINTKTRGLYQIADNLDSLEEHKFLFRAQVLTDISVPASVAPTGSITTVAKANLSDGETFVIDDGTNSAVTFHFDVSGTYTPGGGYNTTNIRVDVSGDTTADNVRDSCITAITGATALLVSASNGGAATVTLTHDQGGAAGNQTVTETVSDVGFVVSGLTGGAGDHVTLVQASSETPTEVAAVNAGAANGCVVATLSGDVGSFDLVEVAGVNAINPKNLLIIRDATTGDPVVDGDDKEIYGLLQTETGVTDGTSFNDTTAQVQISFVVENSTADDLIAADAAYVGGKDINYSYVRRLNLDSLPEQAFLSGVFTDVSASVDVTLDNAIDNQSGPATQIQNIDWRITDTYTLDFQTSDGAVDLLSIKPNAAGDEIEMNIDTLDINNVNSVDVANGVIVDSTGTSINLGVTAGQIDSAGALTLASGGAADVKLDSVNDILFDDGYRAGSTFSVDLPFASSSTDWDNYETAFGEVSLLNALVQASTAADTEKTVAVVTANVPANTNVTGAGGTPNLDAQLSDYSSYTFVTDVDIYLNGVLMRNGADSAANHDVHPGDTPANGDLKFEFNLKGTGTPDVITMIIR